MSKSVLKKEPVPFEFSGEKYELVMCRAYIQSDPVIAYRALMSGLPGYQGTMQEAIELSEYQTTIETIQEQGREKKWTDEETNAAMEKALPAGTLVRVLELRRKQVAIENENGQEIHDAKLAIVLPALMSWDITDGELQLPEDRRDVAKKQQIFSDYGELGEVALDAMWEWYRPTSVASEPTTEATSKEGSTKPHSSTPATESSESLPQSSLPIK